MTAPRPVHPPVQRQVWRAPQRRRKRRLLPRLFRLTIFILTLLLFLALGRLFSLVLPGLAHEYRFTNKTDVGGVWQGQWVMANDRWVTIVYNKGKTPTLPRTGY